MLEIVGHVSYMWVSIEALGKPVVPDKRSILVLDTLCSASWTNQT